MPRFINFKFASYLLAFSMALILWGLLYYSINTRYDHFSISSQPLQSHADPMGNQADKVLKQLGHTGFFWSETAFHFRTTLMYAVDWYQDPEILNHDQWQEFPDGVNAWTQYSLLMEPVLGSLYKWLAPKSLSLIQFLMIVLPLFHVLLLLPVFSVAQKLSGDRRFALVSVAVFSTCSLAFAPLLSSLYVKETFSWFLFSMFLWGHFAYLKSLKRRWLVFAGVGLFLFLISWHLAQFLTIPVMLVGLLCQLFCSRPQPDLAVFQWSFGQKHFRVSYSLTQPLLYFLVFLLAGFVPWLWERVFFLSVPTLLVFLWLALAVFFEMEPKSQGSKPTRMILLLVMGVAIAGVLLFVGFGGDYGHVSGLILSRISHAFQKPMDPTDLPFAVRIFWAAPFSSPRWPALQAGLGLNAILLVLGTLWNLKKSFRGDASVFQKSFSWCLAFFLLAFVLVERLAPVYILLGSVAIASLGVQIEKRFNGKATRTLILPIFFLIPALNLFYSMGGMVQISLASMGGESVGFSHLDKQWDAARAQMFEWIRVNTPGSELSNPPSGASFVGEIGVSTQLLLYTGRPIVLNSQFENQKIRARYLEYLTALYSENEEELVKFCRKYQVDFLFINREWAYATGRNTPKYHAGKTGQSLLDFNISRLHFFPDNSKHFQPVYENNCYRIFAFEDQGFDHSEIPRERTYNRWWDLRNYSSNQEMLLDSVNDSAALQNLDNIFQHLPLELGRLSASIEEERMRENPQVFLREDLLSLQKQLAWARFEWLVDRDSASLPEKIKRLEITTNDRLKEIDPVSGDTLGNRLLGILNGYPRGGQGVLKPMSSFECSPEEYSTVAQILVLLGKFDIAGEFYGKGGAMFPKPALTRAESGVHPTEIQEQFWQETVLNLIAGGEVAKGRNLSRFCATHVSPGSSRKSFFVQAGNITIETISSPLGIKSLLH